LRVVSIQAASLEIGASQQRQRTNLETSPLQTHNGSERSDATLQRISDSPVRLVHARDKAAPMGDHQLAASEAPIAQKSAGANHRVAAPRPDATPFALEAHPVPRAPTRRQSQHERRGTQEQAASAIRSERTVERFRIDDVRIAQVPSTTADPSASTTAGMTTSGSVMPETSPPPLAQETTTKAPDEEGTSSSVWIVALLVIAALIAAVCFAAFKMRQNRGGAASRASVNAGSPQDGESLTSPHPKGKERASAMAGVRRESSAAASKPPERQSAVASSRSLDRQSSAAAATPRSGSAAARRPQKQSESEADPDSEAVPGSPSSPAAAGSRARGTGTGYSSRRTGGAGEKSAKPPEAGI